MEKRDGIDLSICPSGATFPDETSSNRKGSWYLDATTRDTMTARGTMITDGQNRRGIFHQRLLFFESVLSRDGGEGVRCFKTLS